MSSDNNKNTNIEKLLERAAKARQASGERRRRGPVAAAPVEKTPVTTKQAAKATAEAKAAAPNRQEVAIQATEDVPASTLPDRVVMIVGGRHYVAPIGRKHPLKVAQALYKYIQDIEN